MPTWCTSALPLLQDTGLVTVKLSNTGAPACALPPPDVVGGAGGRVVVGVDPEPPELLPRISTVLVALVVHVASSVQAFSWMLEVPAPEQGMLATTPVSFGP